MSQSLHTSGIPQLTILLTSLKWNKKYFAPIFFTLSNNDDKKYSLKGWLCGYLQSRLKISTRLNELKKFDIIWSFSARNENFSYRTEFARFFSVADSMQHMHVRRSKKRGNFSKANTEDDAPGKFFVFSYEITFR